MIEQLLLVLLLLIEYHFHRYHFSMNEKKNNFFRSASNLEYSIELNMILGIHKRKNKNNLEMIGQCVA
jgi:hypothetical protein